MCDRGKKKTGTTGFGALAFDVIRKESSEAKF